MFPDRVESIILKIGENVVIINPEELRGKPMEYPVRVDHGETLELTIDYKIPR